MANMNELLPFLLQFLNKVMPTTLMKMVVASTVIISLSVPGAPELIHQTWPSLKAPGMLLSKLCSVFSVLFLGSFVLSVISIKRINELDKNILELGDIKQNYDISIRENRKIKIQQWKQDITNYSEDFVSFKKTYTFQDLKEELTLYEFQLFCPELCTVKTGHIIFGDPKRYDDKMARFREIVSEKEKEWGIY